MHTTGIITYSIDIVDIVTGNSSSIISSIKRKLKFIINVHNISRIVSIQKISNNALRYQRILLMYVENTFS